MEINFCRRCGASVACRVLGEYRCTNGHDLFYKPYPSACALLLNSKDEVLVAVRAIDPGIGTLDLPGGFVSVGETHKEAIIRELQEEAGLQLHDYTPLEILSEAADIYEYQGEQQPCLGVAFWARVHHDKQLMAKDDVARFTWMSLNDIDLTKILPEFHCVRKALLVMQQRLQESG